MLRKVALKGHPPLRIHQQALTRRATKEPHFVSVQVNPSTTPQRYANWQGFAQHPVYQDGGRQSWAQATPNQVAPGHARVSTAVPLRYMPQAALTANPPLRGFVGWE
jgi:hypothetical protein